MSVWDGFWLWIGKTLADVAIGGTVVLFFALILLLTALWEWSAPVRCRVWGHRWSSSYGWSRGYSERRCYRCKAKERS